METSCVCDIDYDYSSVILSKKIIKKSRVVHVCDECFAEIPTGSSYVMRTYVEDGQFHHFKNCMTCEYIRRDYGCSVGNLAEDIEECLEVRL